MTLREFPREKRTLRLCAQPPHEQQFQAAWAFDALCLIIMPALAPI